MTPQQLRDWALLMGYRKQIQAALAIHKSVSTYSAYINGHKPIPDDVKELCYYKLQERRKTIELELTARRRELGKQ